MTDRAKPSATHFRVVWKREGMTRAKVKRYVHRKSAERLMNILTSPEPWKFYREPMEADELFCCSGSHNGSYYECGCGGLTVRQQAEKEYGDLPPLEFVRIETRTVSPWVSTGVAVAFHKPLVAETEVPF